MREVVLRIPKPHEFPKRAAAAQETEMPFRRRLRRFWIVVRFCLGGARGITALIIAINGVVTVCGQSTSSQQTVRLGIMMPRAPSGAEISGSVTTDPDSVRDIPGLIVVEVPVTADSPKGSASATADLLGHVYVDTGDGNRQRADGPLVLKLAPGMSRIAFKIFSSLDAAQPMAQTEMSVGQAPPTVVPQRFTTSPLYDPKSLQVLHGPTGGDSRKMRIEMGGQPCAIIGAKPGAVFFIPNSSGGEVIYSEGSSGAIFSVSLIILTIGARDVNLRRGQSTDMDLGVSLSGSSGSSWKPGLPPSELVDLSALHRSNPELPETPPQGAGELVVVLRNVTPHVVRAHNMPGNQRTWHLQQAALPLHYHDVLTAKVTGTFNVQVVVVLYAAEIEGQPLLAQQSERTDGRIPVNNKQTRGNAPLLADETTPAAKPIDRPQADHPKDNKKSATQVTDCPCPLGEGLDLPTLPSTFEKARTDAENATRDALQPGLSTAERERLRTVEREKKDKALELKKKLSPSDLANLDDAEVKRLRAEADEYRAQRKEKQEDLDWWKHEAQYWHDQAQRTDGPKGKQQAQDAEKNAQKAADRYQKEVADLWDKENFDQARADVREKEAQKIREQGAKK